MLRVYLAGELCLEADHMYLHEQAFPSRQSRYAFAYLALERHRAVPRDELCEALWPEGDPPASRDVSLSAVMSKVRSVLERVGLARAESIASAFGSYQLRLPPGSWVDVEAAMGHVHEAEGALLVGDMARAYMPAVLAKAILRRPFLQDADVGWARRRRAALQAALLRATDVLVHCLEWNRELALAIQNAEQAIDIDPLREEGYRQLMRLHQRAGNRADALSAYHRCRSRLADELGVSPSPETETLYLQLLGEA